MTSRDAAGAVRSGPSLGRTRVVKLAFDLAPIKWVIHAVGPRYSGPHAAALLAAAYTSSLARADEVQARSVAFPFIFTGVYGYPARKAARISIDALRDATTSVDAILLVAFARDAALRWRSALGDQ